MIPANPSHIRDHRGWHPVIRIDATTVTVATDFDDERVSMVRVLQYAVDGQPVEVAS